MKEKRWRVTFTVWKDSRLEPEHNDGLAIINDGPRVRFVWAKTRSEAIRKVYKDEFGNCSHSIWGTDWEAKET